jgi:DNA-directed RNA polymerase alpha subunit
MKLIIKQSDMIALIKEKYPLVNELEFEWDVTQKPATLSNKSFNEPLLTRAITISDMHQYMQNRTIHALVRNNVRTVGGLINKTEWDIENIDGIGAKGVQEIKRFLETFDLKLKD